MKGIVYLVCAITVLASPALALDTPASIAPALPAAMLSKPYPSTLGDMIASTMGQLLPVAKERDSWGWGIDGPVVVRYDRNTSKLVVSVYGIPPSSSGTGLVDKAKSSLEIFGPKYSP